MAGNDGVGVSVVRVTDASTCITLLISPLTKFFFGHKQNIGLAVPVISGGQLPFVKSNQFD